MSSEVPFSGVGHTQQETPSNISNLSRFQLQLFPPLPCDEMPLNNTFIPHPAGVPTLQSRTKAIMRQQPRLGLLRPCGGLSGGDEGGNRHGASREEPRHRRRLPLHMVNGGDGGYEMEGEVEEGGEPMFGKNREQGSTTKPVVPRSLAFSCHHDGEHGQGPPTRARFTYCGVSRGSRREFVRRMEGQW